MTQLQRQALSELLCEYEDVLSREKYDLRTFITAFKQGIVTGNIKPIRQPARQTLLLVFRGGERLTEAI